MAKQAKKAWDSVRKPVKAVGKGLEKVAQGKIGEGLGDISQTAVRNGLDIITVGNKDKADALSGGLLTATEGAARGNTKDIVRVGATVGATAAGGPGATMAVNSAFAKGGNVFDAAVAGATGAGYEGIANVANSALGNSLGNLANRLNPFQGSAPDPSPQSAVMSAPAAAPLSNNMPLILAGVGGLFLMMMMVMMNNKGK